MASTSTWRWSWKTTSDSSFTVSSSRTSSIFSFSIRRRKRGRTHYAKFSLDHSSSSSSSSLKEWNLEIPATTVAKEVKRKASQLGGLAEGTILLPVDEELPSKFKKPVRVEPKVKIVSSLGRKLIHKGLKLLFGKRPFWRRILFAPRKVRSIVLLNIITIVYASEVLVLKDAEAIMDPAAFTVVRFAVSAIPFLPFVLRSRDDVQTRTAGMELGFWVSLGYFMQALGLLTSDVGRASFLSLFTVIVVPLLDGMLGATVPARTWFGALMSVLGLTMLESSGSPPCVGDLLNFLSAVFFGIHMLRTEHISRSTKKENFLPLLGYEVCVVALLSTMWYFIGGWFSGMQEWDPASWTWTMVWDSIVTFPWIPALYTGVFSTGVCLWIEMAAMRDISATETAIVYGLEPVWGAGFAWFLLGERWGVVGWIGAALILVGSLTVQIMGSSPSESSEDQENIRRSDHLLVSDKRNGFSTSPVVVSTRKNVSDILKK
ncbi:PREDICTED: uncharacterized protein LOC104609967 [Nelumbo nucifera]|uniref:Uncharacterized protein LOC104609967 n=2 Tax=Nelumbo nucifera TaxID=4432 RepID=A0A1U8B1W8_NELNU|nr:PREDICTED: uncharacterized protein LOC104609967 [Nelumbo nucifera]DAD32093.1 TPA_asm: hypothetical protein HUJ06_010944 [Nelumbo nucifera]